MTLGAHNTRVNRARALTAKKGRREQARFLVEGPTLLLEALKNGVPIEEVFALEGALESPEIERAIRQRGLHVSIVDEHTMRRLSDVETPPGIVAVAPIRYERPDALFAQPGVVLVIEAGDPGNVGTLIRAADAFGARAVIIGESAADPYSPKVVRASAGSLFRLPLGRTGAGLLTGQLEGWDVTGLDAGGMPLRGLQWGPKSVLVVGHERQGLGAWRALCTRIAAIEMRGGAESLNAAVAGAIALYEAAGRPV